MKNTGRNKKCRGEHEADKNGRLKKVEGGRGDSCLKGSCRIIIQNRVHLYIKFRRGNKKYEKEDSGKADFVTDHDGADGIVLCAGCSGRTDAG